MSWKLEYDFGTDDSEGIWHEDEEEYELVKQDFVDFVFDTYFAYKYMSDRDRLLIKNSLNEFLYTADIYDEIFYKFEYELTNYFEEKVAEIHQEKLEMMEE